MKGIRFAVPALAGLLLGTALYVAPALSQSEDAATIIRERQQLMKDNGAAMKTIGGYLQGGVGTLEDVAAAADELATNAERIPDFFPPGTGMDDVTDPETGAKMAIWEQWDDFAAAADTMHETAVVVRELALAMDDAALGAAFETLGNDGCGGCHKTFRQKLD